MTPKQIYTLTISTVSYTPNKIKILIISNISISIIIGRLIPSHNRSYIASIIHIIINRTIWSIITTTSGFIIPNTKCCNICPFSWAFPPQRMCRYISTTTCSYIPMYISTTTCSYIPMYISTTTCSYIPMYISTTTMPIYLY